MVHYQAESAPRWATLCAAIYQNCSYSPKQLFSVACYAMNPWHNKWSRFMRLFTQFLRDESGATAIEYGLIAAGISVAIITVVNSPGSQLKTTFSTITSQLATAGK